MDWWDDEDFGKMRDAVGAGWCPRLLSVTWPSSAPLYLATEKHMIGLSSTYLHQSEKGRFLNSAEQLPTNHT